MAASEDIITRIRMRYEGEGLSDAKRDAKQLNESLSGANLTAGIERLDHLLARIETRFKGLEGAIKGIAEAAGGGLSTHDGARRVSTRPPLPDSFGGGFAQAAGLAPYYHEGAFQARRYMGAQAGRMAMGSGRHVLGGLASAPFSGVSGVQQALGGVPLVGGVLAGGLGVAQSAAQQALAYERQRAQLGFAFGDQPPPTQPPPPTLPQPPPTLPQPPSMGTRTSNTSHSPTRLPSEPGPLPELPKRPQSPSLPGYREMGIRYGHDPMSLDRLSAQMSQGAGMSVGKLNQHGELESGIAANRALGLDMGTAGAFARAHHEGLTDRSATETLKRAHSQGRGYGFSLSDISDQLKREAMGIQSYASTGIPISDPVQTQQLGASLNAAMGTSGGVGLQRAQNYNQNVAQRGMSRNPEPPENWALMRAAGYTGKGGLEEYMATKDKLADSSNLSPKIIEKYLSMVGKDAGGGAAAQMAQNVALQRIGLPMTFSDSKRLAAGDMSVMDAQQAASTLYRDAQALTTPGMANDASTQDRMISAGTQLTETITLLNTGMASVAEAFAVMGPSLQAVAKNMELISEMLPTYVRAMRASEAP